jgi:hypothetical protein
MAGKNDRRIAAAPPQIRDDATAARVLSHHALGGFFPISPVSVGSWVAPRADKSLTTDFTAGVRGGAGFDRKKSGGRGRAGPDGAVACGGENGAMPTKTTVKRARRLARRGRRPTTQAGEFIREEMKELKRGSGNVRSRKQAIAIGLSEARRAGVKLGTPARGKASAEARRKAARDQAVGSGRYRPDPERSQGAKKAAATRDRRYGRRAGSGARLTRTRRRW